MSEHPAYKRIRRMLLDLADHEQREDRVEKRAARFSASEANPHAHHWKNKRGRRA